MSLRSFLDSLAQSPAAQRSFFEVSRHAMLRAMARKYPYLPHQILEDAAMQAFGQLWEDGIGQFLSSHPEGSDGYRQDLARYLALVIAPRRLLDLQRKTGRDILVSDLQRPNEGDTSDDHLFDRLLPPPEDDFVNVEDTRHRTCRHLT